MKNYLFALFSLFFVAANAQEIVMGDMNGDGKVTAQDVTEVVNTVTGKSPLKTISANSLVNPDATESLEIALRSSSGTKITLYSNGKATHNELSEVSAYKYYSNLNRIVLLNSKQDVVDVYDIIIKESDYYVLNEKGTRNFVKFFITSEPLYPEISFNVTEATLGEGQELQLIPTFTNFDSTPKFYWESNNENIATVDQNGLVTAVGNESGYVPIYLYVETHDENLPPYLPYQACLVYVPGGKPSDIVIKNTAEAKLEFSPSWRLEDNKYMGKGKTSITITSPVDFYLSFDYGMTFPNELSILADGEMIGLTVWGTEDRSSKTHLSAGKHELVLNCTSEQGGDAYGYIYNMKLEKYDIAGSEMGHEYVDLGLSVKWATCNVGADSPEEPGKYYAWGETAAQGEAPNAYPADFTGEKNSTYSSLSVKNYETLSYYKYLTDSRKDEGGYSKYTIEDGQKTACWYDNGTFIGDNKSVLDAEDDAACANWGSSWRMPTIEEIYELSRECYWKWVESYNGKNVKGFIVYKVKSGIGGKGGVNIEALDKYYSTSDTHIFLPASGEYTVSPYNVGTYCSYWTASLMSHSNIAYHTQFWQSGLGTGGHPRHYGMPIRPVIP